MYQAFVCFSIPPRGSLTKRHYRATAQPHHLVNLHLELVLHRAPGRLAVTPLHALETTVPIF